MQTKDAMSQAQEALEEAKKRHAEAVARLEFAATEAAIEAVRSLQPAQVMQLVKTMPTGQPPLTVQEAHRVCALLDYALINLRLPDLDTLL